MMAATEQTMNSTPAEMAFPRYRFIVSPRDHGAVVKVTAHSR
jgi:hypothetical protein